MNDIILQKVDSARLLLMEAVTIQDTKKVLDVAASAEVFAKRQKMSEEAIQYATDLKMEALRQIGEMLKASAQNGQRQTRGGDRKSKSQESTLIYTPTLAELGIDKKTSSLAQKVAALPDDQFEAVKKGVATIKDAEKQIKETRKFEQRAELVAKADKHEAKEYDGYSVNGVYLADIHSLQLPANSVDMIFTDPPYHDEHLELFGALARFANDTLKPGAYLMTYTGKMFLPKVMNALSECLEYVWMYGIFQPDSNHKIQKHHIFQTWRPIVCFKKPGKTSNVDWQPDMIKGTRDKSFHEWQQQIEAPLKWIEAYTLPNDLVVDPFVGGGTTVAACKELKRNYLGFDIDPEAVKLSQLRLEGK